MRDLTCAHQSRAEGVEAVAHPAEVPVPRTAVPVQVPNAQAAVGVAVDGAPERHPLILPLLGDELGMGQQVVQDVGVECGLLCELTKEIVAHDALVAALLRGEVELHMGGVPGEDASPGVLLHVPAGGDERRGVAVDNTWDGGDGGEATNYVAEVLE